MSGQNATERYDASQDDTFLIGEMDSYLKERWKRALAPGNEAARIEVGQALAHLAGLTRGRLGMTAAELNESVWAVSR